MIIRIAEEGQYEVPGSLLDELNIIDNRIVDLVAKEKEEEYTTELSKLIGMIRSNGKKLDDSELKESDIIVPPDDLTLKEAREIFTGDGLIED
ncbi:hypothetical protein HWN40_03220 [Methanolobus zinderi]|uniref:PspA-associated domain-containing protein n=1 Tax=Methanolobus zinderi TaxID=536044 RepID=A0A7D5I7V4_9EURY|nr:hypothetical protein [Methanolobus zinderi]QLC49342.1 hypothetical protein HWN40_03220 [Methanolobus zinderi]